MIEVIRQNDPYRYVKMPDLLDNGQPDYRIQKWNNHNGYKDMYLCDNWMQMKTSIQDFEYTKWLDPAEFHVTFTIMSQMNDEPSNLEKAKIFSKTAYDVIKGFVSKGI